MKRFSSITSILIILGVIYWSFSDLKPRLKSSDSLTDTNFLLENALTHVKNISKKTHYVGSKAHKEVQNYIVNELEKMGFTPQIQTQTVVNKKHFVATTAENIIVKLKGSSSGKALLLLSHYDSGAHSSFGASDAGSGVATILEGIRAFKAKNNEHKNDVIILFSDAEELGLLGAQAFVRHHPWAKEIGLVLNFEARGSGGPSYMLMETNGKNSKLLSEFLAAKPNYPVANSLMYSIYKKLPNDTDLTVFREEANINGFNFAFIGDHFDYHTAQDTYKRMDHESLQHQADYLMSALPYFANSDIENISSTEDFVYLNFPFTSLLSFPFSWVLPLCIVALLLFLILLFFGISLNTITIKGSFNSCIPFLISLVLCAGVSYYLWLLLLEIYPQYKDILHGFTYNGYAYILGFVFVNLFIIFKVYQSFLKQEKQTNLLIAPLFFWLILNFIISGFLKGAGFFIIPVYGALLIFAIAVFMNLEARTKQILFAILSIPTIYIFAPMIKMFPVGLGLKNMFISSIIMVLVFGLIVLVFPQKKTSLLLKIVAFFAVFFFAYASFNSSFTTDNKKPNSLVYVENSDEKTAYFGTYNLVFDEYVSQIFDTNYHTGSIKNAETKSKYNTRFRFFKNTEFRDIETANKRITIDTLIGNKRMIEFVISPTRKINKLQFISHQKITIQHCKINGALVNAGEDFTVNNGSFLTYYVANEDKDVTLSFTFDANIKPDITINEISFDLLTHKKFEIKARSEKMMPLPFVTNDAIIISKKLVL